MPSLGHLFYYLLLIFWSNLEDYCIFSVLNKKLTELNHRILIGIILTLVLFGFRVSNTKSFQVGEEYNYRVKYGILTIGSANVGVDSKTHSVNGLPCYKIHISGRTEGITDLFKVRNTYTSYMDTVNFLPQKFEYSARENSYKRDQTLYFDHKKNVVVKKEKETVNTYSVPNNIHDVISGYYSLRHVDFSKFSVGQTYSAPLFFDDEHYQFKVRYAGKGTVKTRFGKINVLKLNPVLPNNKLFKGEDAIRVWVSDDKNRVPVKIEADLSVGTIVMEIRKYKRNLFPFSWD